MLYIIYDLNMYPVFGIEMSICLYVCIFSGGGGGLKLSSGGGGC